MRMNIRRRYIQLEVTLNYFGDAVNSRRSVPARAALTTLDRLAYASMAPVLEKAGRLLKSLRFPA